MHHITVVERVQIEAMISKGKTKGEIGKALGKQTSTIGREISKHRQYQARNTYNRPIVCAARSAKKCGQKCVTRCADYVEPSCYRRDVSPGACNGCEKRSKCCYDKFIYSAKIAQAEYENLLISSREGINLTQEEYEEVGKLIAPLLKQGQSVYQIHANHPEIGNCVRSTYNYIESGVFKPFGVDNFSLKEQVNRKQWSKKFKKRKEPANFTNRTYKDYQEFRKDNPEVPTTEMDTVYNSPSGPYIQTFIFGQVPFMIGRLHAEKTNACMSSALDRYQNMLGLERFSKLFSLLLTDRGSEFEKWKMFEQDKEGNSRLSIFYCDPMQSSQKPHVENNHNYIRDILPNKRDLSSLTQADIDLMFSHINSTPRRSLNGKTPFEVFELLYGTETAELLGITGIAKDEVTLKPNLIG
jgi:IS30 family transposase